MGVEKKTAGKKWIVLVAIVALLAVAGTVVGISVLGGNEPAVPTEPSVEATEEVKADDWLREALAEESERVIELNEDLKITEGFEVNGTKTLVGTGKLSMTEGANYVLSVNEGASLVVDGITLNVKNIGNNGVVVRAGGKLEWANGTISYPKQYAIINYGETKISGGVFEYAGANWLYLKSGTTADITGGYFVKSGSAGFEVEQGATLNIGGKDTLMERAGTNTISNYGTVNMTGGTISQSEVWTITNHGKLTMDNVTVKDCSLKGVLYNYADCQGAEISNCTFTNSKTYHVYNQNTVTITNTTMDKSGGSSLNNQPNAVMNVENVSLTNCGYHGIYNDRGYINIKNCSVDTTVYKGVQNKSGFVTIDGMTLNNVGGSGLGNVAVVAGAAYGYIYANNVTLTNTVDYNVVSYGGEVILTNCVFNKTPGANVYIRNGKATIDNCQILGTTTAGKVALALGSDTYRTVETTIKGNTVITGSASRGVTNYGTLYIYSGSIYGNATSGTKKAGGGLYTLGTVYMYGGSITGNRATTYGGGVRVDDDDKTAGRLYMYGGYIGGNYAGSNGGGISVADTKCGLYMYGGVVENNHAAKKGDGLLINGTFELYKDAVIKNNDVYLWNESRYIDVKTAGLNDEPLVIRHGALSEGVVIAKFPSDHDAEEMSSKFHGANNQYEFVTDGDKLVATVAFNDLVSPADFTDAQSVSVTTFQQLKQEVENASGEKIIVIAADIPMTGVISVPASTSVKLVDDGTARTLTRSGFAAEMFYLDREANLYLAGSAGLTLDGGSLEGAEATRPLVFITTEGYLVLQEGATLQNNTNTSYPTSDCAGAVNVYGGRMIMEGGIITNCNAPTYEKEGSSMTNRSAVYVSTSGVLSIKGGEIKDNTNGAIRSYGRIYLSGGTISGNHRYGDGGAAIRAPWLYMTGGTISGNKSTNAGGAVYITPSEAMPNGYFYMNGGEIVGNFTGVNDFDPNYDFNTTGGAIYIEAACTFECLAGNISENQSIGDADGKNGGAIYNAGTVILGKDVVIANNHATRNAGAIFNKNASCVITIEGTTITGNTTDGRGGAIFSEGSKNVVTITDAVFENNSGLGGGALVFSGGTNTITNTVFKGNSGQRLADSYGNGGAILNMSKSNLTLTGCTFEGNKAIEKDGGGGEGGAIYNGGGSINITDCTFAGNTARIGHDILNSSDSLGLTLNGTVTFDGGIYIAKNHPVTLGETFVNGGATPIATVLPSKDLGVQVFTGDITEEKVAMFALGLADGTYIDLTNGMIWADGAVLNVVAKNGNEEYYSIHAAIMEANPGDTITIVSDIDLTSSVSIDKDITITTDGTQRTIKSTGVTGGYMFVITDAADNVFFTGTETAKLILDGNQAGCAIVQVNDTEALFTYVTLQNAKNSNQGGAIQLPSGTGKLTMNNCVLQNNYTSKADANAGGGVFVGAGRDLEMNDSQILNNTAVGHGGAFMLSTGSGKTGKAVLNNCYISGNASTNGYGSVVYATQTSGTPTEFTAINCTFENNTYEGSKQTANGVIRTTGWYKLIGCTFTGNYGYDIYDNAANDFAGTSTAKTNSIASGNTFDKTKAVAVFVSSKSKATIDETNVFAIEPVAVIGDAKYATLAEALAAANDGDTIELKKNAAADITVEAGKTLTVTGAYTVTGNVTANGALNLTDTTISGNATVSGTLTISGSAAVTGETSITGGTIVLSGNLSAATALTVVGVQDGDQVVTGDTAANTDKIAIVPAVDGESLKLDETGKAYKVSFVAQVGDTQYESIEAAIAAAGSNPVVLLANIDSIDVPANLTLNASETATVTNVTVADGAALTLGSGVQVENLALGTGATIVINHVLTSNINVTVADTSATIATGSAIIESYEKLIVAEGYMAYPNAERNGIILVTKGEAKIGDTVYATFVEAVAAAQADGSTVVLMTDVALTAQLKITDSMNIVTDGIKDRTITSSVTGANWGIMFSCVKGEDVVKVKGTAGSKLIIKYVGTGNTKGLVCSEKVDSFFEYVIIEDANRTSGEGGGLYVTNGKATLTNCVLRNNASGGGGAMYLTGTGSAELNYCEISGNTSTKYGGAFQGASGSTLTLNNCTVKNNSATNVGGAGYFAQSSGNPATFIANNTKFEYNHSDNKGGVVRATGAFELTGCTFTGNSGTDADISEGNGTAYTRTITDCTFDKTEAAAIAKYDSTQIVITNCIFAD